ncbi:MAG: hypothetical protein P1P88_10095 [Bacteroidales bacterium]|nr:hypothetical protein [Bacteroidales bacterium]
MKFFFSVTFLIFIHAAFSQNISDSDSCCMSRFSGMDFDKVNLKELCVDFRRLSAQTTLCCDTWNSDLHQIMIWLGNHFGKEGTDISQIIKYMGMPDGTEIELNNAMISLDGDEKALLYFWRSYHDFLYFVYENDKVKYAEWFMWGD